jgi:hypothetical protein
VDDLTRIYAELASRVHQEQLREAEPSSQPPPQLVTIAVFHDPVKAHLARAQLESEGVECFLADEHMARVYSLASFAFGGMKLRVREADVDKATEILGTESEIVKTSGTGTSPRAKTLVWVLILWSLAVAVIVLLFQLFGYFE